MGDSRRFDLFAKVVSNNISKDMRIADVAGGKGYLQLALQDRGYKNITTFDKRNNRLKKVNYYYGWFTCDTKTEFDAVVAMHPDEGTDHSIIYACERNIPFVVCPCCVKPHAKTYWGNHKFHEWVKHLKKICESYNREVIETYLPMDGKNLVLIGR